MKPERTTRAAVQAVLQALWVGVIPALLAALSVRFLVPPSGVGLRRVVAALGHAHPVQLGVALFFVFSLIARYWRFRVPGGRYASSLPASVAPDERDGDRLAEWASLARLSKAVTSSAVRGRLARTQEGAARTALEARTTDLERALETADLASARVAAESIRALAEPALAAKRHRDAGMTLGAVAVAAAIALGARAEVAQSYRVVSNSMIPTFEADDQILGRRMTYAEPSRLPARGDVVLFRSEAVATTPSRSQQPLPDVFLKRVVGLPGDTIAMHAEAPIINGWPVPTCVAGGYVYLSADGDGGNLQGTVVMEFLDDHAYLTLHSPPGPAFSGTYTVQPGEVFVLGDARGYSVDSRSYGEGHGGGVPLPAIVARADRFLLGIHRSGDPDLSRLLEPVARVEHRLHLEGMNSEELEKGIAACLARRPVETHPPAPVQARVTSASNGPGPT
jgi:signal peptidase I